MQNARNVISELDIRRVLSLQEMQTFCPLDRTGWMRIRRT